MKISQNEKIETLNDEISQLEELNKNEIQDKTFINNIINLYNQ